MTIFAIVIILLGLMVLGFGNRLVLFGAGVGALLGVGILRILPGAQESWLWLILPVGLAILFALGSGIAKGLITLISLALGALAGGAIVLAVLDLFGIDLGVVNWILALVGAVIGAGIMNRFKDWGIPILAALVGSLLCVRGLQILFPSVQGWLASLIGLVLFGGALAYHAGVFKKKK
jgi:hypothetical protein